MPHHVLIVEDEAAIAETLVYAFKEAGYTTEHTLLGSEAIALIANHQFDFVVLDVGLPDMSGFEVCKEVRMHSTIPILFLTARNHEIDRIVGLEIGADDYVAKPFSPREVATRVKTILRRTEGQAVLPYKPMAAHQFLVDEEANRIVYDGHYLELTRYEFLLLKTLIMHPKRVYSRNQLMDVVWVHAENTLDRTVDAHVKTLRAKLRKINADCDAIVTHRGMGYSLLV